MFVQKRYRGLKMRRRLQRVIAEAVARERRRRAEEVQFVAVAAATATAAVRAEVAATTVGRRKAALELQHLTKAIKAADKMTKRGAGTYGYGSRLNKTEKAKRDAQTAATLDALQADRRRRIRDSSASDDPNVVAAFKEENVPVERAHMLFKSADDAKLRVRSVRELLLRVVVLLVAAVFICETDGVTCWLVAHVLLLLLLLMLLL